MNLDEPKLPNTILTEDEKTHHSKSITTSKRTHNDLIIDEMITIIDELTSIIDEMMDERERERKRLKIQRLK